MHENKTRDLSPILILTFIFNIFFSIESFYLTDHFEIFKN